MQKEHPQGKVHGLDGGTGGSTELLCSGGPRGQEALARHGRSEGNTPRPRRGTSYATTSPNPGRTLRKTRGRRRQETSGAAGGRELQGKIASIFAANAPQRRLQIAEEGCPQRFPLSRRGFQSFTPFCTHTHRRWGNISSRGLAADRDRRGGRSYGILRCQPREYEYGYGMPCERTSSGLMPFATA